LTDYLFYLLLGIIQGVLEWIPVSSEGFLTLILTNIMHVDFSKAVELSLFLHLGTLFSALLYFRNDVIKVARCFLTGNFLRDGLSRFLFFATASTVLAGLPLYIAVGSISLASLSIINLAIGILLIITGLIQSIANRIDRGSKAVDEVSTRDSIIIGLLQSLSVLPGISRSGITIASLLMLGYKVFDALKMSYMLGIITTILLEAWIIIHRSIIYNPAYVVSTAVSFIVGYLTIDVILRLALRARFWIICVIFGAMLVISGISNI